MLPLYVHYLFRFEKRLFCRFFVHPICARLGFISISKACPCHRRQGVVEIFSYGKGARRVLAAFRCFPMPGKAVEGSKPGLWMAPSNPARPAPAQSGAYSDVDPQTCCSVYS